MNPNLPILRDAALSLGAVTFVTGFSAGFLLGVEVFVMGSLCLVSLAAHKALAGSHKNIMHGVIKKAIRKQSGSRRELKFQCGYCNAIKVSTGTGEGDGHVRIRCKCGGKHGDNRIRMHAKWTRVEESPSSFTMGSAPAMPGLFLEQ